LKGKSRLCDFKARQRNDRTLIFNHKEIQNLKKITLTDVNRMIILPAEEKFIGHK